MSELTHVPATSASENFRKLPIAADHLTEPAAQVPALLTDRQQAAIELLLLGKPLNEVARAVGVSARSLYAWRQDDDFRDELDRRRRELWREAADRLASLVHPALDVLAKHLDDRYDRARFRAASTILRLADLRKSVAREE
jgi:hypothetical protein